MTRLGFLRLLAGLMIAFSLCARAQHEHETHKHQPPPDRPAGHAEHKHAEPGRVEHAAMYGAYPASREASGTSWQPEATPMDGRHLMKGDWRLMLHGFATAAYTDQGGRRGDEKFFGANMLMGMAQRPAGEGTFGLRGMFSLEPATIGRNGYPLLLQTGETGDGETPLIDRQHPHDLFMELALTYSHPVGENSSAFAYFGLPGEPALGPPAFMHRFSGMENPEAPITHHWFDSTHITYGVGTLGYVWKQFKLDTSIFTGREPDEHRWDIEAPRFDSYSARLSWNPGPAWSFQASCGQINSPEQLHPGIDTDRITVSGSYHKQWDQIHWQTLLGWAQNRNDPGRNLDAFLLESTLRFREVHTILGRAENVEKDELFPEGDAQHGRKFTVNRLSLGYLYDFPKLASARLGVGGVGSVHLLPEALTPAYGDAPLSFLLFLRAKL